MDVDVEAHDELSLHEVAIRFAGYRVGARVSEGGELQRVHPAPAPRAVRFGCQFYSCWPTLSQSARLCEQGESALCALTPDDEEREGENATEKVHFPQQTLPALRFQVDCSAGAPDEGEQFGVYLRDKQLHVDVWDADSLMYLGCATVPLRSLMRQGRASCVDALEVDVVNTETDEGDSTYSISTYSTGSDTYIYTEGAMGSMGCMGCGGMGGVVGSIKIVLSNSGRKGLGPELFPSPHTGPSSKHSSYMHRPSNSVRARPLGQSAPELQRALSETRLTLSRHRISQVPAKRLQRMHIQRHTTGSTLNYDEVCIIFRRFRGETKGTVRYGGTCGLLSLLGMPTMSASIGKLVQAQRNFGTQESLLRVRMWVCGYVGMWVCGYVGMWVCGYVGQGSYVYAPCLYMCMCCICI
jgi:hypothetical protein